MPLGYNEISIHRAVIIDVSGATGARSLPTALQEGYSVVGSPTFPDFEREDIDLPAANGFARVVKGHVPKQELTFTMSSANEGLFRAARRPVNRLGATIATLTAGQPQVRFREIMERDPDGYRRLFERVYRGAIRSPIPSYSDGGITNWEVTMPHVVYYREAYTDYLEANADLPATFESEDPGENPDLVFLADIATGRYIIGGVDIHEGERRLLGLVS